MWCDRELWILLFLKKVPHWYNFILSGAGSPQIHQGMLLTKCKILIGKILKNCWKFINISRQNFLPYGKFYIVRAVYVELSMHCRFFAMKSPEYLWKSTRPRPDLPHSLLRPCIHCMIHHVGESIEMHGSIIRFTQQNIMT